MWKRFDKILTSAEQKGFKIANKAHIYTINAILIGLTYGTYSLFRDYNEYFKNFRVF